MIWEKALSRLAQKQGSLMDMTDKIAEDIERSMAPPGAEAEEEGEDRGAEGELDAGPSPPTPENE
jgi:hypothetical protein